MVNVKDILLLYQRKDVSVKWRVLYYLLKSKLGVLYLTSQMTGKPVKHGNLLVNRWSGKSLQFPALAVILYLKNMKGTHKTIVRSDVLAITKIPPVDANWANQQVK